MSKKQAGITLIEVIFIIAIMGLLSTTAILFYQQWMQNQKIEQTVIQMGRWASASAEYYTRNNNWPPDVNALMDQGYMPKNAADSNPWCSKACYSISSNEQLMTITATISGGDEIRTAIAARLPYATKTNTVVLSTVNVPLLKKEEKLPDAVLIDTRPFQIGPMKSDFWKLIIEADSHASNTSVSSNEGATNIGSVPSCSAYQSHSLVLVPVMSGYTTRYDNRNDERRNYFQQALFSRLEIATKIGSNGVNVQLHARPQRVSFDYWSCVWGNWGKGRADCLPTGKVSELIGEITVQGTVFFMCCKEKTNCRAPNNVDAVGGIVSSSHDVRF